MCNSLNTIMSNQDSSSTFLETALTSLGIVFAPGQVDNAVIDNCILSLLTLVTMAAEGYLLSTSVDTYTAIVSSFVTVGSGSETSATS